MKRYIIYLCVVTVLAISIVIFTNNKTLETINFFPIDPKITFDYAETTLSLTEHDENFRVDWHSQSKSNKKLYLRQDVSLLYKNGKLQGVNSKWIENENKIHLKETVGGNENSFFQAISYHHAESHEDPKNIKSAQQMSDDELYIIKKGDTQYSAINEFIQNNNDQLIELDKEIKQQLLAHWDELIRHYQIDMNKYTMVPLTSLNKKYEEERIPLPASNEQRIIGQLWEGLYKNYILPLTQSQEPSHIPIILFANDQSHLLVLFQIDHDKEMLIQKYST